MAIDDKVRDKLIDLAKDIAVKEEIADFQHQVEEYPLKATEENL